MTQIKEWSIVADDTPHLAPELRRRCVVGFVYNHPDYADGSEIHTSYICYSNGQNIITASGSKYMLSGPPHKDYIEWMKTQGYYYNPRSTLSSVIDISGVFKKVS